jgi:hypothetical protein
VVYETFTAPDYNSAMPPGDALVSAANAALADPNVRESVKQMHAEGYGLVQMVEALGLDDDMSGPIRRILEGLSPEAVTGIREAMLAMLATDAPEMPLDCAVTKSDLDAGVRVQVGVAPVKGTPTIQVRRAT